MPAGASYDHHVDADPRSAPGDRESSPVPVLDGFRPFSHEFVAEPLTVVEGQRLEYYMALQARMLHSLAVRWT